MCLANFFHAVLALCASVHGVEARDEDCKRMENESTILNQDLEPSNMKTQIQPADIQRHYQLVDVMRENQGKISDEADKETAQKKNNYVRVGFCGIVWIVIRMNNTIPHWSW